MDCLCWGVGDGGFGEYLGSHNGILKTGAIQRAVAVGAFRARWFHFVFW